MYSSTVKMSYILNHQRIATTHRDDHGDKLTIEDLEVMKEKFTSNLFINKDHNYAERPAGVIFHDTLEIAQLDDGEFALFADIKILDDEIAEKGGGLSYTIPKKEGKRVDTITSDLVILYNPLIVDESDFKGLEHIATPYTLSVVEYKPKALEPAHWILIGVISLKILERILNASVDLIIQRIKKEIIKRVVNIKKRTGIENTMIVILQDRVNMDIYEFVVEVPYKTMDILSSKSITIDRVIQKNTQFLEDYDIRRIVVKIIRKKPYYKIIYFIDNEGSVINNK